MSNRKSLRHLQNQLKKHPEFAKEINNLYDELAGFKMSVVNFYMAFTHGEDKLAIAEDFAAHIKNHIGEDVIEYLEKQNQENDETSKDTEESAE